MSDFFPIVASLICLVCTVTFKSKKLRGLCTQAFILQSLMLPVNDKPTAGAIFQLGEIDMTGHNGYRTIRL